MFHNKRSKRWWNPHCSSSSSALKSWGQMHLEVFKERCRKAGHRRFYFAHSLKFHRRLQLTHRFSFEVWYVWSVECSLSWIIFPLYTAKRCFSSVFYSWCTKNAGDIYDFIASLQCRANNHVSCISPAKVLRQPVFLFVAVNVHFSLRLLLIQSVLGHCMIRQSYTLSKNG